jgi:limonene-1,2-epoxide hydrolase
MVTLEACGWHTAEVAEPARPCENRSVTSDRGLVVGAAEEEVVRKFVSLAEGPSQSVDEMLELMHDEATVSVNVVLPPVVGKDAIRSTLEGQNAAASNTVCDVRAMASVGSTVFMERVDEFDMMGHRVTFPVVGVCRVEDGRIREWREFWDTAFIAKQLGISVEDLLAPG